MILKKPDLAPELSKNIDLHMHELREFLIYISYKDSGIPKEFVSDIKKFTKRNSLALDSYSVHDKNPIHVCCPSCLKAYALEKIKEMGVDGDIKAIISESLSCDVGHDGYFLDSEKIKKL